MNSSTLGMAGERDDDINVSMNSAMSSEELIEVTSTTGDNHRIPQRQQVMSPRASALDENEKGESQRQGAHSTEGEADEKFASPAKEVEGEKFESPAKEVGGSGLPSTSKKDPEDSVVISKGDFQALMERIAKLESKKGENNPEETKEHQEEAREESPKKKPRPPVTPRPEGPKLSSRTGSGKGGTKAEPVGSGEKSSGASGSLSHSFSTVNEEQEARTKADEWKPLHEEDEDRHPGLPYGSVAWGRYEEEALDMQMTYDRMKEEGFPEYREPSFQEFA